MQSLKNKNEETFFLVPGGQTSLLRKEVFEGLAH